MNDNTKEEKDEDDEDEDEVEAEEERTLDKMGNYRSTRIDSISAVSDFPSTTNSCPW